MSTDTVLLTNAQMAEADRLTIAAGTPGLTLMENAGRAAAAEIIRRHAPCPVLVLCGPGNNGGDGFVIASHLVKAGWRVRLAAAAAPATGLLDSGRRAALWRDPVQPILPEAIAGAALVVDAVYGAGLSRAPDETIQATLQAASSAGIPIVAIDVPTGVHGDTGADLGATAASFTITFFRKKPGHLLLPGRALCGECVLADIGIDPALLPRLDARTHQNTPDLWRHAFPSRALADHKFSRGHALLLGGAVMTGATRMAARAAARAGAGLVSIAVPERAWPVYAAALTSIMVNPLGGEPDLAALLQDTRITGLLIGPGAGASPETQRHARALLATGRPVLLDADAITCFRDNPATLFAAIAGPVVLTPHEGEFALLFHARGDKLTRARAAAAESGAIIVLKGADTVVAAPDGRAAINANAPPTLATAGAGDVLGGFILGLLAQGMDPFLAACAGVWLHGAAATLFGPGLLAEDLPDLLPAVLRDLETQPPSA